MIIVAAVILRVIGLVNSPDLLLILTGGGPGRSTQVLSLYAFQKAYNDFNFGYASALSVVMFVLLMGFAYALCPALQRDEGVTASRCSRTARRLHDPDLACCGLVDRRSSRSSRSLWTLLTSLKRRGDHHHARCSTSRTSHLRELRRDLDPLELPDPAHQQRRRHLHSRS